MIELWNVDLLKKIVYKSHLNGGAIENVNYMVRLMEDLLYIVVY